jgi:ubiquinone/menaquinone biosynthesis C-methylase UbiE
MGFDRLAPHYEWMERVLAGGKLQRMRMAWLSELYGDRVLLAGEGHGRFLVPLSQHLPEARITCLDASAGMLAVARRRLERLHPAALERVEWIQADLPAPGLGEFDLIVTNFFLDCFDGAQLADVMDCLAAACAPGGHWLVCDFAVPSHPVARVAAEAALGLMYCFFRVVTRLPARSLESPFPLMEARGFQQTRIREELFGFLTSQLWRRLLRSATTKDSGASFPGR